MGSGMRGMQGTRGMSTRILGNLLGNSGECYHFSIAGNVVKDFGECSKRFRGIFQKIPRNVIKDSGKCSRRFWRMLRKILGNAFNFKLIRATFYCDLALLYLMKHQVKQNDLIFSFLLEFKLKRNRRDHGKKRRKED